MDIVDSILGFNIESIFGNIVIALCLIFVLGITLGRSLMSTKGIISVVGIFIIVLGSGALYRHLTAYNGPGFSFYEGNSASQDVVCNIDAVTDDINLKNNGCENDEIRSVKILNVQAGTILKVFDSPEGKMEDDWTEIYVKKDIEEKIISTFAKSMEDDEVSVYYSRNNGLDGKISRIMIELDAKPSSTIAFYEGNNLEQNKVCELNISPTSQAFKGECDNDEARSALLRNVPAQTRIRLFDAPDGSLKDDWLEIITLQDKPRIILPSLQPDKDTESKEHLVQYHHNNGLDGKVSRVDISKGKPEPMAVFYEGNSGKQNIVCSLSLTKNFRGKIKSYGCANDEARSVALYNIPKGKLLRVFDSPYASTSDDWTEIYTYRPIIGALVKTFASNIKTQGYEMHNHRNNGIDGKISYIALSDNLPSSGIDLHEGYNGSQNLVAYIPTKSGRNIKFSDRNNDEAKSMVLHRVEKGTIIRLYDDPDGNREDDWSEVEILSNHDTLKINSLEKEVNNNSVRITYFSNNGLNGKVSRVEVDPKGKSSHIISLYEGNNGTQNKVCDLNAANNGKVRFKKTKECDNDEARSVRLFNLSRGYKFSVYDDPNCKKNDDWAEITVKHNINSVIIRSFEEDIPNSFFKLDFHGKRDGLDGKVSCLSFGG